MQNNANKYSHMGGGSNKSGQNLHILYSDFDLFAVSYSPTLRQTHILAAGRIRSLGLFQYMDFLLLCSKQQRPRRSESCGVLVNFN